MIVRADRCCAVLRPCCALQGKSTLTNWLLGDERCLTGPEPGLTRDAIKTRLEFKVAWRRGVSRTGSVPYVRYSVPVFGAG